MSDLKQTAKSDGWTLKQEKQGLVDEHGFVSENLPCFARKVGFKMKWL